MHSWPALRERFRALAPKMTVQVIDYEGDRLGRAGVAAMMDGRFVVVREFTVEGDMPLQLPRRDERTELMLPGLHKTG